MSELRAAAFNGDMSVVSLYKRDGEKVNEAGPDTQRTALHWAAWGGQNQVVSCLVKAAKAEINPLDVDGNTPLNLAILAQNVPIAKKLLVVDLLLSHGADPLLPNTHGITPLMNLLKFSKQIASVLPYHLEVMKNIMRKVHDGIRQKAEHLNRTFSISPDGAVKFEKISVPFAPPQANMLRVRAF
jgi:hypothetical protein